MSFIFNSFRHETIDPNLILSVDPSNASSINAGSPSPSDPVSSMNDLSSFNNDLTNGVGAFRPTWETDHVVYSAGTKYLESASATLDHANADYSVIQWAYVTSSGFKVFINDWAGAATPQAWHLFVAGDNKIKAQVYTTSAGFDIVDSGVTMSTNTWYLCAFEHDKTNDLIKVSATVEGAGSSQTFVTAANTNGIGATTDLVRLGDNGDGNGLSGRLGKTQIYNDLVTQAELDIILAAGH